MFGNGSGKKSGPQKGSIRRATDSFRRSTRRGEAHRTDTALSELKAENKRLNALIEPFGRRTKRHLESPIGLGKYPDQSEAAKYSSATLANLVETVSQMAETLMNPISITARKNDQKRKLFRELNERYRIALTLVFYMDVLGSVHGDCFPDAAYVGVREALEHLKQELEPFSSFHSEKYAALSESEKTKAEAFFDLFAERQQDKDNPYLPTAAEQEIIQNLKEKAMQRLREETIRKGQRSPSPRSSGSSIDDPRRVDSTNSAFTTSSEASTDGAASSTDSEPFSPLQESRAGTIRRMHSSSSSVGSPSKRSTLSRSPTLRQTLRRSTSKRSSDSAFSKRGSMRGTLRRAPKAKDSFLVFTEMQRAEHAPDHKKRLDIQAKADTILAPEGINFQQDFNERLVYDAEFSFNKGNNRLPGMAIANLRRVRKRAQDLARRQETTKAALQQALLDFFAARQVFMQHSFHGEATASNIKKALETNDDAIQNILIALEGSDNEEVREMVVAMGARFYNAVDLSKHRMVQKALATAVRDDKPFAAVMQLKTRYDQENAAALSKDEYDEYKKTAMLQAVTDHMRGVIGLLQAGLPMQDSPEAYAQALKEVFRESYGTLMQDALAFFARFKEIEDYEKEGRAVIEAALREQLGSDTFARNVMLDLLEESGKSVLWGKASMPNPYAEDTPEELDFKEEIESIYHDPGKLWQINMLVASVLNKELEDLRDRIDDDFWQADDRGKPFSPEEIEALKRKYTLEFSKKTNALFDIVSKVHNGSVPLPGMALPSVQLTIRKALDAHCNTILAKIQLGALFPGNVIMQNQRGSQKICADWLHSIADGREIESPQAIATQLKTTLKAEVEQIVAKGEEIEMLADTASEALKLIQSIQSYDEPKLKESGDIDSFIFCTAAAEASNAARSTLANLLQKTMSTLIRSSFPDHGYDLSENTEAAITAIQAAEEALDALEKKVNMPEFSEEAKEMITAAIVTVRTQLTHYKMDYGMFGHGEEADIAYQGALRNLSSETIRKDSPDTTSPLSDDFGHLSEPEIIQLLNGTEPTEMVTREQMEAMSPQDFQAFQAALDNVRRGFEQPGPHRPSPLLPSLREESDEPDASSPPDPASGPGKKPSLP